MTKLASRFCFVAVAAAGSALMFVLYARVEWPWLILGWVWLVPWLAALDGTASLRGALGTGLLMCTAFVLLVFSWLPSAIQNYTGAPWGVTLLAVLVAAPMIEPQFVTYAMARHLGKACGVAFWWSALIGACLYVGTEWASPKLFADTLGHGLYASVLMRQAADLAGAHGLTFVLILANECAFAVIRAVRVASRLSDLEQRSDPKGSGPAEGSVTQSTPTAGPRPRNPANWPPLRARLGPARAPAACIAALVMGLLAYGAVRHQQFQREPIPADRVTAALVQTDISQYGRLASELGTFEAVRMILDAHFAMSSEVLSHGKPDLLMWPETVYPTTFGSPKSEDGAAFDRQIGAFVARTQVPLIFGAYDTDGAGEFNAAVFLEPTTAQGVTFETYRKASLFPLTERTPAMLDSPAIHAWLPWLGTWKPGNGAQVVSLRLPGGRTLRVAPLICYDAIEPKFALAAVRHGAEVIVTLSNDSWFAWDGVPRLILIISAFRSIETRRPQLRATTTGVSAVITPTGELADTIDVHQRATLVGTVIPEARATTLMLAWGDWFGPTALITGVALIAAALLRRRMLERHRNVGQRPDAERMRRHRQRAARPAASSR